MLDAAQECVGGDHLLGHQGLDPPSAGEGAQRFAGAGDAQLGQPAAPDQLLRLSEELDLADAAAAKLDVVPGNRDVGAAAMRVDLPLDRMDVLDGGEIEVLAPEKRSQFIKERVADATATG